jgi:hypothetical protein
MSLQRNKPGSKRRIALDPEVEQKMAERVKDLTLGGSSVEEVASALEISVDRLYHYFRKPLKEAQFLLRSSVKRKQIQMALAGHAAMLIWVGKQYCGQRDRVDVEGTVDTPLSLIEQAPKIVIQYVDVKVDANSNQRTKELPEPVTILPTGTTPIK